VVGPHALAVEDGSADLPLECPENHVLMEGDAACIPRFSTDCQADEVAVPGGGCMEVGPQAPAGVLAAPGPCQWWELPLAGGECLPVGPRACPATFVSDLDVECVAGEILPCPEGWEVDADGAWCKPLLDNCFAGEVPSAGGGCSPVLTQVGCPDEGYSPEPSDSLQTLYVSADSLCQVSCGSKEAPYPSIQQAVDAATEGAHVLIGAGEYDEGVLIQKRVHLQGLCPEQTVISGLVDWGPGGDSYADVGLCFLGAQGGSVQNLAVASPGLGVAIIDSQDLILSDVAIGPAMEFGLYVSGSTGINAQGLWIHDVAATQSPGLYGCGVEVTGSSSFHLEQALVEESETQGLCVHGEGTSVEFSDVTLRGMTMTAPTLAGVGLMAYDHAHLSLERVLIESNEFQGMYVTENARAEMSESVVRQTGQGQLSGQGRALTIEVGGQTEIVRCFFEENGQAAITVLGEESTASLLATVVRTTGGGGESGVGVGIQAVDSAQVEMNACAFQGNTSRGVIVGNEARLKMRGTLVAQTKAVESSVVQGAIFANSGASLSATHSLLVDNQGGGVIVAHQGSRAEVEDVAVVGSYPAPEADSGFGFTALYAGQLEAERVLVRGCAMGGVVVNSKSSTADIRQSVLSGTMGNNGKLAPGLLLLAGWVELTDSVVSHNQMVGVGLLGPDAFLSMTGTTIRDTVTDDAGDQAVALRVAGGASASASASLFQASTSAAVTATGAGTELGLQDCVISGAHANKQGQWGFGLEAASGAMLEATGTLVEGHEAAGFAAFEPDTMLRLEGVVVRGQPDTVHSRTAGGQVTYGAALEMDACLVVDHPYSGILLFDQASEATISRTMIVDTGLLTEDPRGLALTAMGGAIADVTRSLLRNNMTAGIMAQGSGTVVQVDESAVSGTRAGGTTVRMGEDETYAVFGDGVLSADGAMVVLSRSHLSGNARCGALLWNASGEFSGNVIEGNMSYGVALEGGGASAASIAKDNWVFSNALELPPGTAQDIATNPGGLPPPPQPEVKLR